MPKRFSRAIGRFWPFVDYYLFGKYELVELEPCLVCLFLDTSPRPSNTGNIKPELTSKRSRLDGPLHFGNLPNERPLDLVERGPKRRKVPVPIGCMVGAVRDGAPSFFIARNSAAASSAESHFIEIPESFSRIAISLHRIWINECCL